MPQISVIVPVYKVEKYIHRCVDSILAQTFTDFELILVDDGSPDNCGAICDEYAARDPRIHVIHQENGGLSAARNAGIDWAFANSDSQWLTFIDSDDWVHKDYFLLLTKSADRHQTKMVMCDFVRTGHYIEDQPLQHIHGVSISSERAYTEFYRLCMTACCKIICKDLLSEHRFPPEKLHEDAYITHLLVFAAKNVTICNEQMYYYFENQESITRAKWTEKRLDELEAHEQRLAFLQDNGYSCAIGREIQAYIYALYDQVKSIDNSGIKNSPYRCLLVTKLRKYVSQYKKTVLIEFHSNYHIYEVAYPRFMKYYWLWQVVLRKLHIRK